MAFDKSYVPEDTEGDKLSRMNTAGLINITLENLWKDCYNSLSKGDLVTWNRKLDAVWLILGGDVKPNDEEDKEQLRIEMQLYSTGGLNHKKMGFELIKEDESQNISLQYLILKKKSLFLRRLQNKQGKGTAYVSHDEDDFD